MAAEAAPEREYSFAATDAPELTIVAPTFNERGNVQELVRRLAESLLGIAWEIVFVDDDSADGTAALVRSIARRDNRVRCVQRLGRRGLASACIEGMLCSSAPFIAIMDADLQHDERLLPRMLTICRDRDIEVVIASRYRAGSSLGRWQQNRAQLSRVATWLSHRMVSDPLTDPMSGFFLIRRAVFEEVVRDLSPAGFKILLDIFASSPRKLRFTEVSYEFRERRAGQSKLDSRVMWDFLALLLDKCLGRYVPVHFLSFAFVGALGSIVHLAVLSLLLLTLGKDFTTAQSIAAAAAMTFNFTLNNMFTYRDRRLRGWSWVRGWARFCVGCSAGAVANIGVAAYVYSLNSSWLSAALAGLVVGSLWNYAITRAYTWGEIGRGR